MGKEMWHVNTMELHAVMEKNSVPAGADKKRLELDIIALSKATWTQKQRLHVFSNTDPKLYFLCVYIERLSMGHSRKETLERRRRGFTGWGTRMGEIKKE